MSYIVPKEMPKNCIACPCGYETEGAFRDECSVLAREYEDNAVLARPNWCPLIEVPTPHGRLIDADELSDRMHGKWTVYDYEALGKSSTIIEAEGREVVE